MRLIDLHRSNAPSPAKGRGNFGKALPRCAAEGLRMARRAGLSMVSGCLGIPPHVSPCPASRQPQAYPPVHGCQSHRSGNRQHDQHPTQDWVRPGDRYRSDDLEEWARLEVCANEKSGPGRAREDPLGIRVVAGQARLLIPRVPKLLVHRLPRLSRVDGAQHAFGVRDDENVRSVWNSGDILTA